MTFFADKKFYCIGSLKIKISVNEPHKILFSNRCADFLKSFSYALPDITINHHVHDTLCTTKKNKIKKDIKFNYTGDFAIDELTPEIFDIIYSKHVISNSFFIQNRLDCITCIDYQNSCVDYIYTPSSIAYKTVNIASLTSQYSIESLSINFNHILLHASALLLNKGAVLFLAFDEGGKTTAARLGMPKLIIGDDRIFITKISGKWYCHTTPWNNLSDAPRKYYPIASLVLLQKSSDFSLFSIPSLLMLKHILSDLAVIQSFQPTSLRIRNFEFLSDLTKNIYCYQMKFPSDYIDWEKVESISC